MPGNNIRRGSVNRRYQRLSDFNMHFQQEWTTYDIAKKVYVYMYVNTLDG